MQKLLVALMIVLAFTLAGCSDGGADSNGGSSSSSTTGSSGSNMTGDNATPEPIIRTGTISGAQDCALASNGQAPASAVTVALPAEASNRSYELSFTGGQSVPTQFRGCIGFGTAALTGGTTGTVPDGATSARIAINSGQGRTYTLTIT